jgi:hypothetical protein
MINIKEKVDRAKVKQWIRETEGSYDVVMRHVEAYIDGKDEASKITGQNEFETLRILHINQGKVEGVREFFEQLEKAVE